MILQLHCPLCLWPRWLFAGTQLTARHSVWSSSKSCSLLLLPVDAHTSILPSVVHILQLVAPIVASFYLCVHLCGLIIQTCTLPPLSVSVSHVPPNIIPHIGLNAPLISLRQQSIQGNLYRSLEMQKNHFFGDPVSTGLAVYFLWTHCQPSSLGNPCLSTPRLWT